MTACTELYQSVSAKLAKQINAVEKLLAAVAAYERTLRLVHADAAVRQTRIPEPGQSIR